MTMKLAKVVPFLAVLLTVALPPSHAADFIDPLDAPAAMSELAKSRLLNDIARAGERLVAVGQRGHILYSDDQGLHWTQAQVPVSVDLLAVQFATPSRGWAVGHSGVVLTTDNAGRSWTRQLDGRQVVQVLQHHYLDRVPAGFSADPEGLESLHNSVRRLVADGADKPFHALWFDDEKSGYVVGPFNLILRTRDGGNSWEPLLEHTDNPQQLHFFGVRRVDGELYAVGEAGLVLRLDSISQRWRRVSVDYPGTLFGLTGNPGTLLVYGLRGNAFRSTDRGESWTRVNTGVTAGLMAGQVAADGSFQLISQSGQILSSTDQGRTFKVVGAWAQPTSSAVSLPNGGVLPVGTRGVALTPVCLTESDCS